MVVFKCKMCGGALEINSGETVATCQYCGTQQTLPKLDDERRAQMYDRANHFRRNNEFDKAMGIYEQILNEDATDAEAYWSLVLCRYGIEYVEDPATRKRLPTVNRAQFTSVYDDDNYKSALQHADSTQKALYEQEAKVINDIQKGILAISQKEAPFDIFICYKETDPNGRRTPDSVLAQELYYQLTQEGFKVFFSRITLEDKLGSAYEPYIFAALNSAKVMVALGTKPEHFNAVWVKNEWSRYLALIKNGAKKVLIPAYRDMDPYDLPEEFSHLQAQDMSKLGFMQDLIRGIKKLVDVEAPKPAAVKETVVAATSTNIAPLLKRAFMFLEDGEWERADEFCEQVLNIDPECAEAYLGKLMAELQIKKREALADYAEPFDNKGNYQKALRFGDDALKAALVGFTEHIHTRNETERLERLYTQAKATMDAAGGNVEYRKAAAEFDNIAEYRDAAEMRDLCIEKAEVARKEAIYNHACDVLSGNHSWLVKGNSTTPYETLIGNLKTLNGWRDSEEKIQLCQQKIAEIEAKREEAKRQAKIEEEKQEQARKKRKKIRIIVFSVLTIALVVAVFLSSINFKMFRNMVSVSTGSYHTVGVRENGTVVAVGDNNEGQCEVDDWKNIESVSTGYYHTVGLKKNGTVVATGSNSNGQCDVDSWKDIVSISANSYFTAGLKEDGTVVIAGQDFTDAYYTVNKWTDIVSISAGGYHLVGLKKDGTVVSAGWNNVGQCDVGSWTDIESISAGAYHTVGLKKDGTVVAVGENSDGQCDVQDWKNVEMIAAGGYHTVGLKKNGNMVETGDNKYGQCNVEYWSNIESISAGVFNTIGIKENGNVVMVGMDNQGQCDVGMWK